MKEKILEILEKHDHGLSETEFRCVEELLGLIGEKETPTEEGIIELSKIIKQYGISISDIEQKNNIKRQTRRELQLCIGVLTHLMEFMYGERVDPATGTSHLTAAEECLRLLKSGYRQDNTYGGTGDYDQYNWTGS